MSSDKSFIWQIQAVTKFERHELIAWLNKQGIEITRVHGESIAKAWVSKTDFTNLLKD